MKKLFAMVLALAMALSVCAFASAEDTVKIGVIGPMTGAYAQYGLGVYYGAEIAVEEVNAQGGVQFELLPYGDDQGDGELAINAYNDLLDKGTQIILGTVTSGACAAVSDVAMEERIFMLTPSASADAITEGKDMMFRVCFKDSAQGVVPAQYIVENNLATKVGVIYNNAQDYSMGIYQSFKATADELGLEIVAESAFSDDSNADFSVQIAQMQEAGAELVFLPIYYTPASNILTQAKNAEYAPIFFGVDGMDGILGLEGFDSALAEGVMLMSPFSADATDDLTVNFVTKYQTAHGDTPNQFAADAYDGVYALYEAVNQAGITAETSAEDACELLISAIQEIEISGLTGNNMKWSADGEVDKAPLIFRIEGGKYVKVD